MTNFEIKDRDLAGRIGKLKTNHGVIETPTIFPVINPNKIIIKPKEMREYGASGIITNAYILQKDYAQDVLDIGIHNFLDFDGPIMTDSGTYQMYSQGITDIDPTQIINFQKAIGADIITPVDIFTLLTDEKNTARKKLVETVKRIKEARKTVKQALLVGPIQGGSFLDLRKTACKKVSALEPDLFAIGGAVPLMEKYAFAELFDIIVACKKSLPSNKAVHAFGCGHPMLFTLLTAIGCDLFDSAMYGLAAERDCYLTSSGTYKLQDLDEFPCNCPICNKFTTEEVRKLEKDERQNILARHNLYATFGELRVVKQAIHEKTLWDLLEQRCHSHPALLEAMNHLVRNADYFSTQDPLTKKHFFYVSGFSKYRPEVKRVKEMIRKVKGRRIRIKPFGKIPETVFECYPFSQTVLPAAGKEVKLKNDIKKMQEVSRYWFGTNIFDDKMTVQTSRKTDKVRAVYDGNKLIATVRASDFMILLHEGAKILHKKTKYPEKRVVISDPDAEKFISKGKSVFSKFVEKCDKNIIPGQQVLVVNRRDKLIASGEALLNSKEMSEFERGVAVFTRWVSD